MIRDAIESSIGVPRKTILSLSRREYKSKARSERPVSLQQLGQVHLIFFHQYACSFPRRSLVDTSTSLTLANCSKYSKIIFSIRSSSRCFRLLGFL